MARKNWLSIFFENPFLIVVPQQKMSASHLALSTPTASDSGSTSKPKKKTSQTDNNGSKSQKNQTDTEKTQSVKKNQIKKEEPEDDIQEIPSAKTKKKKAQDNIVELGDDYEDSNSDDLQEFTSSTPVKRSRGRPKGSRNKKAKQTTKNKIALKMMKKVQRNLRAQKVQLKSQKTKNKMILTLKRKFLSC